MKKINKETKIGSAYSTPLPLNLGGGVTFWSHFLYNTLYIYLKNIKEYYEEIKYILHHRPIVTPADGNYGYFL